MDLRILPTRNEMGLAAAVDIAADLRARLAVQPGVRIVFAAAPSQSEMLAALIAQPGIEWARITAFHMDEYIGLPADAPQRFAIWLRHHIFGKVPFASVHLIDPADHPSQTCQEYAAQLNAAPIDLTLCGIGTNGHLAFNDPPADLNDPATVKIVQLDRMCRQQQVDDQCFARIEDVPRTAITLTVPALLRAQRIFCCVPGPLKKAAVRAMVNDPISGTCPATALRNHPNCIVYLDRDSAADLKQ